MKPVLLIIEDDEGIRSQLNWALASDYEVVEAGDRPGALSAFRQRNPLLVLLDLGLPPHPTEPVEGMALLTDLSAASPDAKVIVVSGQGEKKNALQAIGAGAYDFLCKPVDLDELKVILKRSGHVALLEREYRQMQQHLPAGTFEGMMGTSLAMQEVFSAIRKVATTEAPVLVLGASGTGKEMAALAIHRRGSRKEGPFVVINCGAIPENLLESELFGHEKGAFTGAHIQRRGRIETATGGTLFLDEVGELPSALQVKLLRFLQDQVIERVGGRSTIQVDTRVIAATNSDLKRATEESRFREDLFYRLAVVVIRIPPLRERTGDIHLLAHAFLQRFAGECGKPKLKFSPAALDALRAYDWPGNVRELENRIQRAVIMAEGSFVGPEDMELPGLGVVTPPRTLKEARESLEGELVKSALQRHRGNISRAATDLGISRPTLYDLMDKLGIKQEKPVVEE